MATYKDILVLVDKVSAPLQKIQKQTEKFKEKTEKLRSGLKKFGKALGVVAAAVGVVGGALVKGINKFAELGDRIDKMSQKIGMSRKAFQEWDYIMSQNGGSVDSLQMGFKTLTTQIEGVQKGSKDSIKAFKELGVQVKDNNGKFRSADDIFNDTVRSLQKIENPTQKMILANRLFGRSAAELRPLLNQEASAIDELRKKANDMGLIISDEDVENSVKFKDTMDTFSRFFQAKFATQMMKIMPFLSKTLEDLIAYTNENQELIDNIGVSVNFIVTKALPAVIKFVVSIINFCKKWLEIEGKILGNILSIPTYLSIIGMTIQTKIIVTFAKIKKLIIGLGAAVVNIFNTVKSNLIGMFNTVKSAIISVAQAIGGVFNNVIGAISQWIQNILEKIQWLIGKMPIISKFVKDSGSTNTTTTNNNTSNVTNITNNYNNGSYKNLTPLSSGVYAVG